VKSLERVVLVVLNKGNYMEEYSVDMSTGSEPKYTFDEYQDFTKKTAVYPENTSGSLSAIMYCALGLSGEAGEVANKVKKLIRDGDSPEKRKAIAKEIGDCIWYIPRLLEELGSFTMAEVAKQNVENLQGRLERGTLHGNGDNR